MSLIQKIKWRIFKMKFERNEVLIDKKIGGKPLNRRLETKHGGEGAKDTQSTDYRMLAPLFQKISLSENDKLVDIGCGQGRVLSYLITEKGFKGKLVGIELDSGVAEFTRERFREYPQVEIINKNAVGCIPFDGTVFYLFNPFDGAVLRAFLDSFENTVKHPALLIYGIPVHHAEFEGRKKFTLSEKMSIEREYIKHAAIINIYAYNP